MSVLIKFCFDLKVYGLEQNTKRKLLKDIHTRPNVKKKKQQKQKQSKSANLVYDVNKHVIDRKQTHKKVFHHFSHIGNKKRF